MGYITEMNTEFALKDIDLGYFDENYFIKEEKKLNKNAYLDMFELIFEKLIQAQISIKKKETNNSAFKNLKLISKFMDVRNLCDISIEKNDILFSQLDNFEETKKYLKLICYKEVNNSFTIDSLKVTLFNRIRNNLMILKNNNFKERNFFNGKIKDKTFDFDWDFYIFIMRPYFNKYRNTFIKPFLKNQLDNALYICIGIYFFVVIIDIILLFLIKYLIINKANNINKYLVILIDVIKK